MVFPLRVQLKANTIDGWLLVGPRPDNRLPSRDERRALVKITTFVAYSFAVNRTRKTWERDRTCSIGAHHQASI